jgi:hypothetical protein
MKKFVCYWGEGYDNQSPEVNTLDFFTEDVGYSHDDIQDIAALEVGKVWMTLVYPEGEHFVLRVK